MSHFSTAVKAGDFNSVPVLQEIDHMIFFVVIIMSTDVRSELDFFRLYLMAVMPRFLFSFGLLVSVFSKIQNSADRRFGSRSNFHQVEISTVSFFKGFAKRNDPKLLTVISDKPTVISDKPDFTSFNFMIYASTFLALKRTFNNVLLFLGYASVFSFWVMHLYFRAKGFLESGNHALHRHAL